MVVRREIKRASFGVVGFFVACALFPSSWVMQVHDLRIVDSTTVSQARTLIMPMWATWTASIQELRRGRSNEQRWVSVCTGSGDFYYQNYGRSDRLMDVSVWVGAPCKLHSGHTYRPVASWRPRLFPGDWHPFRWLIGPVEGNPYTVPGRP